MHRIIAHARRPLTAPAVRALSTSPLLRAPVSGAGAEPALHPHHDHYAKDDHTYDPVPQGTTHYVVAGPGHEHEHTSRRYDVPSGAFPTSSPYDHFPAAPKPERSEAPSSTSTAGAHPNTTARVPTTGETHPYGSSSAVRHTEAAGEMARGADKGAKMSEGVKVAQGAKGELAERNAWPSEEQGKKGLGEAWKGRK